MCLYMLLYNVFIYLSGVYLKHNFEINLMCVHVAVVSLIHRNMNLQNLLLIENKEKAIYDSLIMVFKQ